MKALEEFDKKFVDKSKGKDQWKFGLGVSPYQIRYFIKKKLEERDYEWEEKIEDILEDLTFFLFPHQTKRTKEFMAGYNYCKKGTLDSIDQIKNNLKQ